MKPGKPHTHGRQRLAECGVGLSGKGRDSDRAPRCTAVRAGIRSVLSTDSGACSCDIVPGREPGTSIGAVVAPRTCGVLGHCRDDQFPTAPGGDLATLHIQWTLQRPAVRTPQGRVCPSRGRPIRTLSIDRMGGFSTTCTPESRCQCSIFTEWKSARVTCAVVCVPSVLSVRL